MSSSVHLSYSVRYPPATLDTAPRSSGNFQVHGREGAWRRAGSYTLLAGTGLVGDASATAAPAV
eukprot:11557561-Alexandrium_andersonii.AAC.1